MTKVSIVGVEGSGKTVLMAVLGDRYKLPDKNGLSLKPDNFETYSYVENQMAELQGEAWPQATTPDVMQTLGWTLQRSDANGNIASLGDVPFLDFAGEVYRYAFGSYTDDEIRSTPQGDLTKPVRHLRGHVKSSQCLVVLVNLSHVINGEKSDRRTQETVWLTQRIVDFALEAKIPCVALALTQCDRYRAEIEACGGVAGALRKYMPHVATSFPRLTVFEVSAVGAVKPSAGSAAVPCRDAEPAGLEALMSFMVGAIHRRRRGRFGWAVACGLVAAALAVGFFWRSGEMPSPPRKSEPQEAKEKRVTTKPLAKPKAAKHCKVIDLKSGTEKRVTTKPLAKPKAAGRYKVIDLKSGTVTHIDAVPTGGWTDEYKTAKLVLRRIEPGTFTMGSPLDEEGRAEVDYLVDYEESHPKTLTKPYYIGVFEVTQGQWERVMGTNPSNFKSPTRPVEKVSWNECQMFCRDAGHGFRLPTEVEWEYSCRAGTTSAYFWGDVLNGDRANCNGNYPCGTTTVGPYKKETTVVGSYAPNAWGLYDMHGNVSEWCADRLGEYLGDEEGSLGLFASGRYRVIRGGSWQSAACYCRSANRSGDRPGNCDYGIGFRICCSAGPSE